MEVWSISRIAFLLLRLAVASDPIPKGVHPGVDPGELGECAAAAPGNDAHLGPQMAVGALGRQRRKREWRRERWGSMDATTISEGRRGEEDDFALRIAQLALLYYVNCWTRNYMHYLKLGSKIHVPFNKKLYR